jgi:hypothetical protein
MAMLGDPNLKNRDIIEAIEKSINLTGTYRALAAAIHRLVCVEGGSLPEAPGKRQAIVAKKRCMIRPIRLATESLRR